MSHVIASLADQLAELHLYRQRFGALDGEAEGDDDVMTVASLDQTVSGSETE